MISKQVAVAKLGKMAGNFHVGDFLISYFGGEMKTNPATFKPVSNKEIKLGCFCERCY